MPVRRPARRAGLLAAGRYDAAGAAGAEPVAVPGVHASASFKLVQADKRLGLFEWTLHQILLRHLRPQFEPVRPPQIVYYGLQQLGEPMLGAALDARPRQPARRSRWRSSAARRHAARGAACELLPPEACGLQRAATRPCANWRQVAPKQRGTAGRRLRRLHLRRLPRSRSRRPSCCGRSATCSIARCRRSCPGKTVSPSLFAPREPSRVVIDCDADLNANSTSRPAHRSPRSSSAPHCCAGCASSSTTAASSKSKRRCWPTKSFPSCTSSRFALEDGAVSASVARTAHEAAAGRRRDGHLPGDALVPRRRARPAAQSRVHDRRMVSRRRRHARPASTCSTS